MSISNLPQFISNMVSAMSDETIYKLYEDLKSWSDEEQFIADTADQFRSINETMRHYLIQILWSHFSNFLGAVLGEDIASEVFHLEVGERPPQIRIVETENINNGC